MVGFWQMKLHRSRQTPETIIKSKYWRQVCPELHVNDKEGFQPATSQPIVLSKARQAEVAKQIEVRFGSEYPSLYLSSGLHTCRGVCV